MPRPLIPVSAPTLAGNEKRYVMDCIETNWISARGKYVDRFEEEFARFCGVKHGIACTNGTVALHLALLALGIGPGDEVIVPTLTYIATANSVRYCGATPVMVVTTLLLTTRPLGSKKLVPASLSMSCRTPAASRGGNARSRRNDVTNWAQTKNGSRM